MKSLSAPALAALASGSICIVQLVALEFPVPIYLNTSTWDLTWQRRYNLLTHSEQFDNGAAWFASNLLVTPDAALAPDGTMNADLCTTFGPVANFFQTKTATAETMTFSVYVKADTATFAVFDIYNHATGLNVAYGVFVFATGTGSGGMVVDPLPGGWFRISLTASGLSIGDSLGVYPGVTGGTYTVGMSWYTWGAQLEAGDIASTYTPTTTTALNEPGVVYKGAYGLGSISAVSDKPGEISGISLELAAGSPAIIALALDGADEVQGTVCTIRTAIIDTATYQILDAPIEWSGTLDTMSIGEDGNSAVVSVSAESKAVDLLRGTPSMYVDEEQTLINPTDRAFKYVVDQVDKPLIWPSRGYFQQ